MRNRYPGTCYRCCLRVEAGTGHFEKHKGEWRTQHADCAIRWRGKPPPSMAEARAIWAHAFRSAYANENGY